MADSGPNINKLVDKIIGGDGTIGSNSNKVSSANAPKPSKGKSGGATGRSAADRTYSPRKGSGDAQRKSRSKGTPPKSDGKK